MRRYSEAEIKAYIATADPMDKAGAYGIQNPSFQPTARIDGCYWNVVGLPIFALVDLLAEFDVYPVISRNEYARGETGCPWSEKCLLILYVVATRPVQPATFIWATCARHCWRGSS